ncbi:MAG: cupin domain-containing protein [Acidobacteriota bacterium]|nr:cupin domain-containing protein [Acidobacteriota bacterium]
MPIISKQSAEHYTWGLPPSPVCDGWHLVSTPALSIIEERLPPGASEIRHAHRHAHQFFFVLEGEFTLEVEGSTFLLHPGEGLEVAPGKHHQAFNLSSEPVRILVTSQPPSHGDRIVSAPSA